MYQDKSNLMPAGSDLVRLVLARDFQSPETADAAITVIGAANAYRSETPGPFGATSRGDELRSENEAIELAESIDSELPRGFGADGEGAEKIKPETLEKLKKIALFVLQFLPLIL